jgi:hypothetical protein
VTILRDGEEGLILRDCMGGIVERDSEEIANSERQMGKIWF